MAAASDSIAIRSALERYEDIDINFQGSREGNLLKVRVAQFLMSTDKMQ